VSVLKSLQPVLARPGDPTHKSMSPQNRRLTVLGTEILEPGMATFGQSVRQVPTPYIGPRFEQTLAFQPE
jgi:hypothetical protein